MDSNLFKYSSSGQRGQAVFWFFGGDEWATTTESPIENQAQWSGAFELVFTQGGKGGGG